ncbi:MAG: archaetidylserine decarboxylase [Gammaproteobacteria bacterium]
MAVTGVRIADWLKSAWQYVIPQHALSRLAGRVSRVRARRVKNWLIRSFMRRFNVDLSDALISDPESYGCFNDFFTRALRPGARPIAAAPEEIVSPADGRVSQCGGIEQHVIFQAKGRGFTTGELLGDVALAERFEAGSFVTLYLSPRDYHRVHMPVDGRLLYTRHIPGRRFSVNPAAVASVPRLFARNERLVTVFDTPTGPLALVLVGALNVGSIKTVWASEGVARRQRLAQLRDYRNQQITLVKGVELGRFNMGSTVILLFAHGQVIWDSVVQPGADVRVGMQLGRLAACDGHGVSTEPQSGGSLDNL